MNLVFKLVVWFLTESDSMLAETIHSAADTFNQGILVYGICQRAQVTSHHSTLHSYGLLQIVVHFFPFGLFKHIHRTLPFNIEVVGI